MALLCRASVTGSLLLLWMWVLVFPANAATGQGDTVCTSSVPGEAWLAASEMTLDWTRRPALVYAYSRLPVGDEAQIAVQGRRLVASDDGDKFANLRVLISDDPTNEVKRAGRGQAAVDTARAQLNTAKKASADLGDRKASDPQAAAAAKAVMDATKALLDAEKGVTDLANELRNNEARIVDGLGVTPSAAAADNGLVRAHRIDVNDLLVNFTVPSTSSPMHVLVVGCDLDNKVVFLSTAKSIPLSNVWLCGLGALFLVVSTYVLVALAALNFDKEFKEGGTLVKYKAKGILYAINPVAMTSGPDGKGSLARLQILFFTVLLSGILSFLVLRLGYLSDMSNTVLELLGISAVGAAAAKGTDGTQNRLKPENWGWLTSREWLPPNGLGPYTTPRWRDLVTSEDGFDVYHFQMLVFSLVVAGALLQASSTDIASFKIPDTLLGVLGLSQVAYVGGKLVAPPSYSDLDKLITEIRVMEDDYIRLCTGTLPPSATDAERSDLASRKDAAGKAYMVQMGKVTAYFATIFGTFSDIAKKMKDGCVTGNLTMLKPKIDLSSVGCA